MGNFSVLLFLVTHSLLLQAAPPASAQLAGPMACSQPATSCPAYLYYTPQNSSQTPAEIASLFNVSESAVAQAAPGAPDSAMTVQVDCVCSSTTRTYSAQTSYRVAPGDASQAAIAEGTYENMAMVVGEGQNQQPLVVGEVLQVNLLCGCNGSSRYVGDRRLLTYVAETGDTLGAMALRFGTSVAELVGINNVSDPNFVMNRAAYYIPFGSGLDSGPGRDKGVWPGLIAALVIAWLLSIVAVVALAVFINKYVWCFKVRESSMKAPASHGIGMSGRHSWGILGSGPKDQGGSLDSEKGSPTLKNQIPLSVSPRGIMNGMSCVEKPILFGYDELAAATKNFDPSNQIGVGAHGCVYFGLLRDQEVAIKRMKASNTKEFLAELKILCKVHHKHLVELIGYSVSENELLLVYEYAENRALSDILHQPNLKGIPPIPWNTRVQIALDVARGLQYIHEYTVVQYVHCDVKTSNILLDGLFGAKVADFGLAKLLGQSHEEERQTPVVGTVGYLAPERLQGGQTTPKSDVYSFGVVLFELITGTAAILRSSTSPQERRSIIPVMLSAVSNSSSAGQDNLRAMVDPLLQHMYPPTCVFKMAILGQQCVQEDPKNRPGMKKVVCILSQILLASIEWAATNTGSSEPSHRTQGGHRVLEITSEEDTGMDRQTLGV